MDLAHPHILWLIVPALALLWWAARRSEHSMPPTRRHTLTALRMAAVVLALLTLAQPALRYHSGSQAVMLLIDRSQSLGESGQTQALQQAQALLQQLPDDVQVGVMDLGGTPRVRHLPGRDRPDLTATDLDAAEVESDGDALGQQTDIAAAIRLAQGLFPAGAARRMVLISDGQQTQGDAATAAREAAVSGVVIDALPVAGQAQPDVRVLALETSRPRLHEGAALELTAHLDSSMTGPARVRLFENGVEVASEDVTLAVGDAQSVTFLRYPAERGLYTYRVRIEPTEAETLRDNNEGMAVVDVQGRPLLLYVEGEAGEAQYLTSAMAREGIALHTRPVEAAPQSLADFAGYDGVIFSDVPAYKLQPQTMTSLRDYVEQLGGGFLMVGGVNSFGVGGYYRTPVEEILPVKIQSPDTEERYSVALALVIDRSGSMSGSKIEICKSAAVATVELLSRKDHIAVVAFDSQAHWVVPMTRVDSPRAIAARIATLNAGGGTNIQPGMEAAHQSLRDTAARVKHMIVLTDGQTGGGNYDQLARQIRNDGITISTVGVGSGAATQLLQTIAQLGGGDFYATQDYSTIPQIFTQDAMMHTGRLVREETFQPRQVERHPMLAGWSAESAPPLMGYVRTHRKATAQVPLVTDTDDPLLAHWRFGLGKVTAFTSDCKSRWSALWLAQADDLYSQFWAQVLREMARQPQGRLMDVRLTSQGEQALVSVDLLADAASFDNAAHVEADWYFVPAGALGSGLKPVGQAVLEQRGPGQYEATFPTREPGLYLVRARSGARMVSAGLVRNVSDEAATGRVDEALLAQLTQATGGQVLGSPTEAALHQPPAHEQYASLVPWLLQALLLVFLADVVVRRWENASALAELATDAWRRTRSS